MEKLSPTLPRQGIGPRVFEFEFQFPNHEAKSLCSVEHDETHTLTFCKLHENYFFVLSIECVHVCVCVHVFMHVCVCV